MVEKRTKNERKDPPPFHCKCKATPHLSAKHSAPPPNEAGKATMVISSFSTGFRRVAKNSLAKHMEIANKMNEYLSYRIPTRDNCSETWYLRSRPGNRPFAPISKKLFPKSPITKNIYWNTFYSVPQAVAKNSPRRALIFRVPLVFWCGSVIQPQKFNPV